MQSTDRHSNNVGVARCWDGARTSTGEAWRRWVAPRARSETPLDEYGSIRRSHIAMAAGQSGVQTRSEERWSRSAVTYESDWNGTDTLSPLRALEDGTITAVDVVVRMYM